jgi:hypothetical protein
MKKKSETSGNNIWSKKMEIMYVRSFVLVKYIKVQICREKLKDFSAFTQHFHLFTIAQMH